MKSRLARAQPIFGETRIAHAGALRGLDIGETNAALAERLPVDSALIVGHIYALDRVAKGRQFEMRVEPGSDGNKPRQREERHQTMQLDFHSSH
jgi:hypothetical protein